MNDSGDIDYRAALVQLPVAVWFWYPFQKAKWYVIIGLGAVIMYFEYSQGMRFSLFGAFVVAWSLYAAVYGVAGFLTFWYISGSLEKRDPERIKALRATGAQTLVGPDMKGLVVGALCVLAWIGMFIYGFFAGSNGG